MPTNTNETPDDLVKAVPVGDGGVQFETNQTDKPPADPEQLYPKTSRYEATRLAEIELGKKRVAEAEKQKLNRPAVQKSQKELQAEGRSTEVFRPANFDEYRNTFKLPQQSTDKKLGG
jgi:hypothetical protein